jgi:hypothetical protein
VKRNRSVLLWTPVLIAGALIGAASSADATLPSTATPVTVTQGNVTSAINGHVHRAASIAGNIKSAATGHAIGASVSAYRNGNYVASAGTNPSTGHYEIDGLFGGTYKICVSGFSIYNPPGTGFLGRCYKTAPFNGSTVPSGALAVTVIGGQHKTGISFNLLSAAAISGKVTNGAGTGLPNVSVTAHNRSSGITFYSNSTSIGAYVVKGLTAAAKGYTVCFAPYSNTGTGYRPRCFKNTAWNGFSSYPTSANAVGVVLGHTHTGINQALLRGGAISGKVTDASNGNPINGDSIAVFTAGGRIVGGATTNSHGNYVARGLAASTGYRVCAAPVNTTPTVTYHGKCWRGIAWNGRSLPAGTTPVAVQAGQTHTGINFRLSKTIHVLGSIAGQVTEKAGGTPLQGASVTLFRGGQFFNSASTNATGHYKFTNLPPSTSYVVCATGKYVFIPTPPATGWAPRCHTDAGWNGVTSSVPAAATRISLTAGQDKTGQNVALHVGGEIDGFVFVSGGTTPAPNVNVFIYTTGGKEVAYAYSAFDGSYSVNSLAPATYIVCFDGRYMYGLAGFLPQCYNNVAWNGTA